MNHHITTVAQTVVVQVRHRILCSIGKHHLDRITVPATPTVLVRVICHNNSDIYVGCIPRKRHCARVISRSRPSAAPYSSNNTSSPPFSNGIMLLQLALLETAWCVRQTGCLALNCYFSLFFPCFVSPQHMPPTSRMLFSSLPTILVMAISHTPEARRGRRTATAWHGRECASPMPTRRRRSAHQPATASSQAATIGGAR